MRRPGKKSKKIAAMMSAVEFDTVDEFVFRTSLPVSAWRTLNKGVTMETDSWTKKMSPSDRSAARREKALDCAIRVAGLLREPGFSITETARDLERYLANGAVAKKKK